MRERLKHDRLEGLPPGQPGKPRLTGLAGLSEFVAVADPEVAANAMVCAIHQAAYLLKRQLERQGEEFLKHGGFTENLHRSRSQARRHWGKSDKSDRSDQSDKSDEPKEG